MPFPGQTISRQETYTNQFGVVSQVVVITKPTGYVVSARDVNDTDFPGLEATCITAFGTTLWNALKALDPEPPSDV